MKVYLAAHNDISEKLLNDAKVEFLNKFKAISSTNFVSSDPDIIWFISGGSEHNALSQIDTNKRYCLIASKSNNSWASATEVKANLNARGVKTRIFDFAEIESFEVLNKYLGGQGYEKPVHLGMLGKPADWLVASIPDYELLKEVFNIEITDFSWEHILKLPEDNDDRHFAKKFGKFSFDTYNENLSLMKKINSLIKIEKLDAIATGCFDFLNDNNYSACLPVSALNSTGIPSACEGDICSAAGMIASFKLLGLIPWMANLNHVGKERAIFSHCTIADNYLESFDVATHFESGKASAIKGVLKKGQVTVFRVDRNLEYCFLSLGEIVESGSFSDFCRTQAFIKMSAKSLFLLREFPLGNHHLILPGDHTNVLAEYFTDKGLRIV